MKLENHRLLAVAAHPDDETVFMGGTLAKYARLGVETHVLFLTDGERGKIAVSGMERGQAGFREVEDDERQEFAQMRRQESVRAGEVLGIKNIDFLGYPDQGLDASIILALSSKMLEIDPHVVISLSEAGTTMHSDHMWAGLATFQAIMSLLDSSGEKLSFRRFFTFTLPGVGELFEKWAEIDFTKEELTYVDVSGCLEIKKQALTQYSSQAHLMRFFDSVGIFERREEIYAERVAVGSSSKGQDNLFFDVGEENTGDLLIATEMPFGRERYLSSSDKFGDTLSEVAYSASKE